MKAYLIEAGVLERVLEALQSAMTELETLEYTEDWFVSDSLETLRNAYNEMDSETMTTMSDSLNE